MSKIKYLVIVESPAKARTIHAILGEEYDITASMGHIIDLPLSTLAIDVDNGFTPKYHIIRGKEKTLAQIKKKAKNKKAVYIATDPDREGEAIGWHIKESLAAENDVFHRVTFHEITESALKEAFSNPGQLDLNKVNAQIARRVLDRIVGYHLSPLLWKKIVRGLSAGRVQSVALKFIAEREKEIAAFTPKTTYFLKASLKAGDRLFEADIETYKGKKAIFETKESALEALEAIKNEDISVKETIKKETRRKPPAPYTTSMLQQDGFNRLHFSSQKTMLIAQKLYEGVEIETIQTGLITYMRTDSVQISSKAKNEIKDFISNAYGKNYLTEKEYSYKEKKGAQLAHEAIRPASVTHQPQNITSFLESDENLLYEMIWKRTVASLMKEACYENTKIIFKSASAEFTAEGRRLVFDGFLKVAGRDTEEETILPELPPGDKITLEKIEVTERTTKPPPRFNDASLVKLMEEKGIGRPSTYAPTISVIIKRNYVRRERGCFMPTELGIKVNSMLMEHFPIIINEDFTAKMEEELDKVEEGAFPWQKILEDFYPSFKKSVSEAEAVIKKEVVYHDKSCPLCKKPMVVKWSRKGRFLSCSDFPKCRHAESILTEVTCPTCKEGKLVERRNKRGQYFYGCSKFPSCRYTSRSLPKENSEGSTGENIDSNHNQDETKVS